MDKIWKVHDMDPRLQKSLSKELGVTPVFSQLLVNRGIKTAEQAQQFLFGDLSSCYDPFLMKDMDKAVGRIKQAVDRKEKILIYGDYDVDGVTSTALMADTMDRMGADYDTFIPNRLEDGYGLNIRAVALARDHGIKLIVTVDCGINSVKEVECANEYGIDVIITDHHVVKEDARPPAYAVVDPHQPDCEYPYKYLAGVGVAYKVARALMAGKEELIDHHLDLVALGTIADVVPLNGENRILAKAGLKGLRNTDKPGLKALMEVSRIDQENISCRDIGFGIGPRINAMGRVGSANQALELLLCKDDSRVFKLACTLDDENKNRKKLEKDIVKLANIKVKAELDLEEDKVIVLGDESWHPGVIGIAASRLAEEYLKPTILISFEGDKGKGSGRSVNGFDLFGAINAAGEHLLDFGGHKAACGVKIMKENISGFRDALNGIAEKYYFEKEEGVPEISIDAKIPFAHIGLDLIKELKLLMPYGVENSEPVFATCGMKVKNSPREIGRGGLKFLVTCGNLTYEAVTFRKNQIKRPRMGDIINLAYGPSINSWNGIDSIQLNIKDLKIVGSS